MDDELRKLGRAAVRVAAVPKQKLGEEAELRHGEVGGERCLLALLPDDTDTCGTKSACMRTKSQNGYEPTSAAWIMLTSFPPSPIQQTRFLVNLRIRRATSAFCVGEHRHATTADSFVAISINSFLNMLRHSCHHEL